MGLSWTGGRGVGGGGSPPVTRVSVLGRVDLTVDGESATELIRRRKPFALLTYLALDESTRFVQRDELCGVFWSETTQARARASLRQALAVVRKHLPHVLETRGDEEIRVIPGSVRSDVGELLAAVADVRWGDAERLDTGAVFAGFHLAGAGGFEDWLDQLRLRLSHARALVEASASSEAPGTSHSPGRSHERNGAVLPGRTPGPTPQPARKATRMLQWATAAGVVAAGLWLLGPLAIRGEAPAPMLAVETPDFLGSSPDGRFVARGLQAELVAHLAAIPGLALISAGEVRDAESRGLNGRALYDAVGARYGLEISMQEEAGSYRVVFALVDGRTGEAVLSDITQPPVGDLLDVRADIASQVAAMLALDSGEGGLTYAGATEEAIMPYLAAVGLLSIEGSDSVRQARWARAEELLSGVRASAPDFAAAHAQSALLVFRQAWLSAAPDRSSLDQGEEWLATARQLDPNALEVRLASAYHAYYVERDWESAIRLSRVLTSELEHDHEVSLLWAMAERRAGDFERSIQILESRLRRHPVELPIYAGEIVNTYRRLGRWDDAQRLIDALEQRSGRENCAAEYSTIQIRSGDAERLDQLVDRCRTEGLSRFGGPAAFWHEYRMRRFERAIAVVDEIEAARREAGHDTPDWLNQQWAPFPLSLWRGAAYQRLDDDESTREAYARDLDALEARVDEFPELSLRRQFLAMAYAGSRREDDAVREAQRAVEIAIDEGDQWSGIPSAWEWLARVYAEIGQIDDAVDILEDHLTNPERPWLRLGVLRLDPSWDPLRESPRFSALLTSLEARERLEG